MSRRLERESKSDSLGSGDNTAESKSKSESEERGVGRIGRLQHEPLSRNALTN